MTNSTAEQAIRKVANSLINTHRPQLGACHSTAVEASLEALAELADELSLLDIYAELTKRLEILRGGQRPPVLDIAAAKSHQLAEHHENQKRSHYAKGFELGMIEASNEHRISTLNALEQEIFEVGRGDGRQAFGDIKESWAQAPFVVEQQGGAQ